MRRLLTIPLATSAAVLAVTLLAACGTDDAGDQGSAIAGAPAAQQASIAVAPSTAGPGDTITFSGTVPVADDCPPGDESARLTSTGAFFPPDGFGPQAPRDADGDFQVSYTIPTTTAPGTYTIGMRCGGGNIGVSTTLQVTGTASTAGPPAPAPTEPQFTG